MVSSINPANIDGAFPVAGQDNDSQGFRDNFTSVKNNLTFAKSEIEALQVSGATLTGPNDFSGNIIKNAELQDNSVTVFAKGTTSGTITFDHTQGHVQTITTSGNQSWGFTNYPVTTKQGRILVVLTVADVNHIITLPGSVTTPPGFTIAVDGVGTYWYEFVSNDGGTTYFLFDKNRSYDTDSTGISITSNTISSVVTNQDINIVPSGTGNVELQKDTNITGTLAVTSTLAVTGAITGASLVTTGNITGSQLGFDGNKVVSLLTNSNIVLDPAGTGDVELTVSEQTTIGANGAASVLTANPLGYFQLDVNGRQVIVPFYNL